VLEKYPKDVKVVFMNFPLSGHRYARLAAAAAIAANNQGKFWEFHDKLFKHYKDLNQDVIENIAKDLGLDMAKFNKDLRDPETQSLIFRDLKEGRDAGVRGTPTVFVNGKVLKNRSLEGLTAMIQAALKPR
jgi:protein-disulfide isomerase